MRILRSAWRLPVVALGMAIAIVVLTMLWSGSAKAVTGLVTEDLSTGTLAPNDMVNDLVGAGVNHSNVSYSGALQAAGNFSGGTGIVGFENGLILSSGAVANVVGPNTVEDKTASYDTPGDVDLDNLVDGGTQDAAILEFDFVPNADNVFFQYVFASEEYNEYVGSPYNDVFAFFVNGENCAIVEQNPVAVNTINAGSNPAFYVNNDLASGAALNTEMDGLTTALTCEAPVNKNQTNHIKLTIADRSDAILDSNVFLQAGSFSTTPPTATEVEVPVDVKPTSCRNPLNVGKGGMVPAAILGTEYLDVTQIDPASVTLQGISPARTGLEDVATPFEPYTGKENAFDCTTAGADGFQDLTLKFNAQQLVGVLGETTDGEVRVLKLTGNLKDEFGGTPFVGEDVIVTLKKQGKKQG